jgi:predicted ATP-dependent endonuclease of OLD family
MKISSIHIENFRSFRDQTISIDDYSCFVGPNGAGKSTVLSALNLFFQYPTSSTPNVRTLDADDFHNKHTADPIRITVTFEDLSDAAKESLKDYIRHDKLIITTEALWNSETETATVKQHGQRLAMKAFADRYFSKESENAKVADLKPIYAALKLDYPELPAATTGGAMKDALQAYEAEHADLCEPIRSSDEFYGANSGKLNPFVQWVYVPAVKDAQEEGEETKKGALGQLLARTVRATTDFGTKIADLRKETFEKFEALLEENQEALGDISDKLKKRLAEWSHADTNLNLRWISDKTKSVQVAEPSAGVFTGEGDFTGKLSRMGHGLQRSYLLALLTELAGLETENAPTLILACEEPELYQHPPQARRLSDVFQKLSESNTQVFVTTHSPYFVSGKDFSDVRLVRKSTEKNSVVAHLATAELNTFLTAHSHYREQPTADGLRAKISQSLQPHLNEMFFCRHAVFVEGLEDIAFITAALHLYGHWDEFHALGCHLVPANGKNHLIHPVAIASKMNIPYFLIFDCDGDCREQDRPKHELDNKTLLSLVGATIGDGFPAAGITQSNCRAWASNMGNSIEADFEKLDLCKYMQEALRVCGGAKSLTKNSMFITEWLTNAHEDGKKSTTLDALCTSIISSAR